MEDSILDSAELNAESAADDDEIAYVKGGTIHKKIIPILLSPKVVFPFHATHPIVTDSHLKQLFEQAFEEKTVVGYLYHPENVATKLPKIEHVGVAASVTEVSKLVDGSYLVGILPVNRFFVKEYINADPKDLTARVSYYWDIPEDESIIRPLALEYIEIQKQINETIKEIRRPKAKPDDELDPSDRVVLSMHAYASFATHPKMTEDEKQYLLWMYKLSERLMLLIELMSEALPAAKRVARKMRPFRYN